jgi:hypothetical protein
VDASELSVKWDAFMEGEGEVIQQEIYDHLQDIPHLLDVNDGIHAKWTPDHMLGVLLVFSEEEAECLFDAFRAALEGVPEAGAAFACWTTSLMGLLRQALSDQWSDDS